MKKFTTPILKYAIDKAKRNKFIQNLFESPLDLSGFPIMDTFPDSHGNIFKLRDGLRSKIRPGWERMLQVRKEDLSREYLSRQKQNGEIAVDKIQPLLNTQGKSIEGSTILEIGCHSGGASFAMAERGAARIVGSEFAGYKVESMTDPEKTGHQEQLLEVTEELKKIRAELSTLYRSSERVEFVDDDVCRSSLPHESFDIICSWEVLEHLHDPSQAFSEIHRLLKKDGITIHEYNPFFCLNGGHSLCTLDFLWGHTRIDEQDFIRYMEKYRPNERNIALSFYQKGLNRMTLSDLEKHLKEANLKVISIIPFTKEQHLRMLDQKIYKQSVRHYPELTLLDLATPRVIVMAKK